VWKDWGGAIIVVEVLRLDFWGVGVIELFVGLLLYNNEKRD
jgi:hypothetical protein